jgi:cyclic pyranopterin phosphate synthase
LKSFTRRGEGENSGQLTHVDDKGRARMVDISAKKPTERIAVAMARVQMKPDTLKMIEEARIKKGDVLAIAQVAGIMAAKRTSELIPLCHPIAITAVEVEFEANEEDSSITVRSTVKTRDRTGVEMEALVGVSAAALTIYDMCKAVDRGITITDIQLMKKSGGRSGTFIKE